MAERAGDDGRSASSVRGYYDVIETPIGALAFGGCEAGLHRVEFLDAGVAAEAFASRLEADCGARAARGGAYATRAAAQLRAYFAGERTAFELTFAPRGSAFRRAVWAALERIRYGETASYGELAQAIGWPGAARAVGSANRNNPLSVVVPCHRVIGADGALTGYGGGLERKAWLLALEARVRPAQALRPARALAATG